MVRFPCPHCGAKLQVSDAHAGKKGRCPRCRGEIAVPPISAPQAQTPSLALVRENPEDSKTRPKRAALDAAFLEVPRPGGTSKEVPSPSRNSPGPAQDLREKVEQAASEGIEPAGGPKLPWFLDVLLYPLNLAGVIHLVSLWLLVSWFCPVVMDYLGLGTEFVPFVYTLPVAYVVYYLAECIRDSAGGARRAPDFWMSPGDSSRWDCLSQFVQVVGCVAVCFWPVSVYYIVRERSDEVYWLLLAGGGFLLPMTLLAVVWFDSYAGLNPVLIAGSIFRTFVPYSALVLLLGGEALLFVKMGLGTNGFRRLPPLPFVLRLVQLYLLFVAAGLLGRFYQRYKERLSWNA